MNGAESLLATALACGIDTCFANPGTTELDMVAAFDEVEGMRSVLGLFEGVLSGAADGYARVTGRPALTLTHLGPGFANALANLHNARRARTPIINVIGDHPTWHLAADAPLTSDIEGLAGPMSIAVSTVDHADEVGPALSDLVAAAMASPGGPATMILRQDAAWSATSVIGTPPAPSSPTAIDANAIAEAVDRLRAGAAGILLGGTALDAHSLRQAHALGQATGATVLTETMPATMERGLGIPAAARLPYFPEPARAALADLDSLVLIGARPPVAFFGYREGTSSLLPDATLVLDLAPPGSDTAAALDGLLDGTGTSVGPSAATSDGSLPEYSDSAELDTAVLGNVLAGWLPEHAIVVDESTSSGGPFAQAAAHAPPHLVISQTGGAIGQGLPCAVGAAVAAPDRPVVAFQADGSAAYTAQALWTMAREELDVTIVICANRSYRILQIEMARAGQKDLGHAATALTDIDRPGLDWVDIAKGFGVAGARAATAGELSRALERAARNDGPFLIEAELP